MPPFWSLPFFPPFLPPFDLPLLADLPALEPLPTAGEHLVEQAKQQQEEEEAQWRRQPSRSSGAQGLGDERVSNAPGPTHQDREEAAGSTGGLQPVNWRV